VRALRRLLARLLGVVTRRGRERAFDEELWSHVEMHTDDGIRAGLSPEEARRQALVMLGGVQQTRETYADGVTLPSLESVVQDVRFAVRMLAKAPGFTAVAVFVVALGIGANAAVFSLINAILLRPVNGTTNGTLMAVSIGDRTRPGAWRFFSYPEYVDVRGRTDVFRSVVAETPARPGLEEGGRVRRISARIVSSNFFSALGATMAAGRGFTAAEENPGDARCDRRLSVLAAARVRSRPHRRQPAHQRQILYRGRRRARGLHRRAAVDGLRRVVPVRCRRPGFERLVTRPVRTRGRRSPGPVAAVDGSPAR
jgi:hypothetical protein